MPVMKHCAEATSGTVSAAAIISALTRESGGDWPRISVK